MSRLSGARRHAAVSLRVVRAVLRNPALRRVEIAFLLFSAALYGSYISVLIYAYDASGAAAVGVVALAQLLPAAVVAPFAASLADRYPRDRVLLAGYIVQAVSYATAAAGMLLGAPPLAVYAAAAVAAAATTFTRPAQGALLPSLSRTPEELTAANSVSGTIEGAGVLLGPLTAAAILTVAAPGAVWAAGAVACAAAALLVADLRRPASTVSSAGSRAPRLDTDGGHVHQSESVGALVLGGLQALGANADTRLVVGLLAVRMLISGAMDVLFVLLANGVFETGQAGAGLLNAGLGLGTVLGGMASIALIGRQRMAPALGVSALVWAVAIVIVATVAPAWLAPVGIAVAAVGFAATDVAGRTILQRVTEDRMLARVLGALEGIGLIGLAIGSVLVPVLAGWLGIRGALAVVGLLLPLSVAIAWLPLVAIDRRVRVPVRELAVLRRNAIFAPLPGPQLETAATRTRWMTVEPGDVLIREGDVGDRYYVLVSGELRITIGGRWVRTTAGPGEGMGEIALLRGVTRGATVTAVEPCVVLALERDDFLEAVTGHESAHEALERAAASRAVTQPEDPAPRDP